MTMKRTILFLVVAMALFSCAPTPQDVADAEATSSESRQGELDAIQAREQKIKMDAIQVQEAERAQEIKDAGLENAKKIYSAIIYWGGITLVIVLMYVIVSVGKGLNIAIEGAAHAIARAAIVKANLIYLDPKTGQFPQLLEYLGDGNYSLTDMNDHSTLLLNTHNEPDKIAVRGALAVRHALVMSNAASRSKDPTGVAMVQPLIIDQVLEDE